MKQTQNRILFEIEETKDIIVENQRGITLLGVPFFSPSFLLPGLDPPNYQLIISNSLGGNSDPKNKSIIPINYRSGDNPRNKLNSFDYLYPLPWNPVTNCENNINNLPQKNNKHGKWYVKLNHDMVEDEPLLNYCDDQGWIYSWRFRSNHWKDRNGLVRRRIWVKLDERE